MVLGDLLLLHKSASAKRYDESTYEMSTMSSTWLHMATNRSKYLVQSVSHLSLLPCNIQFASTYLHLHLHGSTPLESLATSDNQSKVMSAETRVSVWGVIVGKASRA